MTCIESFPVDMLLDYTGKEKQDTYNLNISMKTSKTLTEAYATTLFCTLHNSIKQCVLTSPKRTNAIPTFEVLHILIVPT